jgi:hypothetical protein
MFTLEQSLIYFWGTLPLDQEFDCRFKAEVLMIAKVAMGVLLSSALVLAPSHIAAQTDSQPSGPANSTSHTTSTATNQKARTLTGCIRRGEAQVRYKLVTNDGDAWELVAGTLKLDPDVDHAVKVSGKVVEAFDTEEAKESTIDKDLSTPKRHGIFQVNKLTIVSTECGK